MLGMLIFSLVADESTMNKVFPFLGPLLLVFLISAYIYFTLDRRKHPERYAVPDETGPNHVDKFKKTGDPLVLISAFEKNHLLQTAEQLEKNKSPEQKAHELRSDKMYRYKLVWFFVLVSLICTIFIGVASYQVLK